MHRQRPRCAQRRMLRLRRLARRIDLDQSKPGHRCDSAAQVSARAGRRGDWYALPAEHRAPPEFLRMDRTGGAMDPDVRLDRKSTRLNSSHHSISYAVFCLKKKKNKERVDKNERRQKKGTNPRMKQRIS